MDINTINLELQIKSLETSYIRLLQHTTIEIEKLKVVTRVLLCVDQKKTPPVDLKYKLNQLKDIRAHRYNLIELNLFHNADDEKYVDVNSYKEKVNILTDAKFALIKSASFEMERLRKMIKYLTNKINGTGSASSSGVLKFTALTLPANSNNVNSSNNSHTVAISSASGTGTAALANQSGLGLGPDLKDNDDDIDDDDDADCEYDWDEIKLHNSDKDLWLVYENKIYDITRFLRFHPGGVNVILEISGKNQDITSALKTLNHPPIADTILLKHFIGTVADVDADNGVNNNYKHNLKPIWNSNANNLSININRRKSISKLKHRRASSVTNSGMIIVWTIDIYSVKIDILDQQHKNLTYLINRLYRKYELKDLISLLHRWDVHCKTEETLFFYYNFDDKTQQEHNADHKRIYHKIKDQITDLRIKYNNEKPKCDELITFAQGAAQQFKVHHFTHDSKYVDKLDIHST